LSLAVARYLHHHPDARERVSPEWIGDEVERWAARDADAIGEEATHRLEVLEQWVEETQREDPGLYETRRMDSVHARMALQSSRSGAFGTAAGPLADFLTEAGEQPDTLFLG
jgi:hypothetical protein